MFRLKAIKTVIQSNKDLLFYIILMGLAAILGFSRNIIFGYTLDPENMGYYSIIITISSYGVFLQIGLMSGLTRELPVLLGKGDKSRSLNLVGETTTSVVFLQILGISIYFLCLLFISFESEIKRNAFFLAGLVVIPSQLISMVMLRLRSEQRELSFAFLQLVVALFIVLIGYIGIQYLSYKGTVLALVLVNLIAFFTVTKKYLDPVNYFYFNKQDLYYLFKIGFPVMLAGLASNLYLTMDRLFLFKLVNAEDIGIYQMALLPMIFGVIVNSMAGQYLYPKLLFEFGEGKSIDFIFRKSLLASIFLIILMLVLLPIILFSLNYIIENWLPLFKEGLPLMTIFYIGAIFTAANLSDVVISAVNRPSIMLYQNIAMAIIAFISFYLASSSTEIIIFAYIVLFLQIIKLLSSLLINYILVKTFKRSYENI